MLDRVKCGLNPRNLFINGTEEIYNKQIGRKISVLKLNGRIDHQEFKRQPIFSVAIIHMGFAGSIEY